MDQIQVRGDLYDSQAPIIDNFTVQPYQFLSNFSPIVVHLDGDSYRTLEHAYQAAKCVNPQQRIIIQTALTPGSAKRLGQEILCRPDWEKVKDTVMLGLLREKFAHDWYRTMLLATGKAKLIEGNWWGDRYWGVYKGQGLNKLGELLMKVRLEIRDSMS
jgi:ribA/ribD-fused uncharacterized protein